MRKNLLIKWVPLLLLISSMAWAQERTITGRVTSSDDGSSLPGVNVVVKGTTTGTVTDSDGRFSLSAPSSNGVLVLSFIGLKTQEVNIDNRTVINIKLESDYTQLNEVVVTQTGYTQEKKFLGSAVSLGKDILERAPMASLDQSLQGRAAGVQVNSGSGQPGAAAAVRIRGVSSITGAAVQPLYVIDGIPVLGALAGINSNDIESQTILKDGSTGALYGARGANGVIVINTKRGKSGQNTIDYRTQIGISTQPPPNNFSMMSTEQTLKYEETLGLAGFGINGPGWVHSNRHPTYAAQSDTEKARRDSELAKFRGNNRNYADLLFRNGVSTTNELVASGGTDNSRYYVSFNLFDQDGFAEGSKFTRYTGRVNFDQKIDKFSLNLLAAVVSSQTNNNVADRLGNSTGNPFQIVWRAKPYESVFKSDGTLDFGTSAAVNPRNIANALERQENTTYKQNDLRILGGLGLKYQITKDLSVRNNFGVDINYSQGVYAVNPNSYAGSLEQNNSGFYAEGVLNNAQVANTTSLNYSRIFNTKHEVEFGVYYETIKVNNRGLGFFLQNLDKRLTETGQGAGTLPVTAGQTTFPQNASSAKSSFGIQSYFGTARYTYADKYTANFNFRRDGTSRILNSDNKEIMTWSAGLGWDLTNEGFFRSQRILTDAKIRITYGAVPNIGSIQTSTYALPGAFFAVPNYLGPQLPTFSTTNAFAGSSIAGLVPSTPGNPSLKIETIQKYNIGFDVAIKNKARLVVDFYQNTTVDLFVSQPLSATVGFGGTTLPINAGQMTNKGIESTLLFDIYKRGDWSVDGSWNHAINVNNIDDLGAVNEYQLGTFLIKKGLPYGSHYTLDYQGADKATGKPIYRKEDGQLTDNQTSAGQVANFGTFLPKHVGGVSLSASYKKIKVSTLFSYQFDVVRSNNVWSWVTRGIPGYINAVNQSTVLLDDQWLKPGDEKFYQSPDFDRGFTSADLMDARFLRFREVTVFYTLPKLKFVKSVQVYGRVQNLAIWSPWKGLDPEDDNNVSLNEYPNPRMFVFGLDFSF
ncbi:MAG: SusC/RagA family TonB-linked outer membrane protein [Cyclobacteriaceae bacterium]|nr:SusC/RagA family TonB-linked outer membrane protein [Cyclobacteriaceae bacterium]